MLQQWVPGGMEDGLLGPAFGGGMVSKSADLAESKITEGQFLQIAKHNSEGQDGDGEDSFSFLQVQKNFLSPFQCNWNRYAFICYTGIA